MEEKITGILPFIIIYGVIQNFILAISILSQLRKKKDIKKALSFLFIGGITDSDLMKRPAALLLSFATFHAAGYFTATAIFLAGQIPGKIAGDNIDDKIKIRLVLNVLYALCFL